MNPKVLAFLSLLVVLPLYAAEQPATVTWAERSVLAVPVSGVVQTVHVRRGQRVEKGQALASLDDRRFRARLDEGQARVDGALPALDEAKRELERARDLYERTVLSDHELRLAEIGVSRADAAHRIALAELARAKLALEHSVLRAPFNGVIVELRAQRGQVVASRFQSVPLVTIASTDALLARTELEREVVSRLEFGQDIDVLVAKEITKGSVHAIATEPTIRADGTLRYGVDVRFEPPTDSRVLIGVSVILHLP